MRRRAAAVLRAACVALLVAAVAAGKDLYSVLGIARGADEATIKKNYHKLALCVARGARAGHDPAAAAQAKMRERRAAARPGAEGAWRVCVFVSDGVCVFGWRRKWHPDKNPTNKEAAEAQFREARARRGAAATRVRRLVRVTRTRRNAGLPGSCAAAECHVARLSRRAAHRVPLPGARGAGQRRRHAARARSPRARRGVSACSFSEP
jgi:hypothetical protein